MGGVSGQNKGKGGEREVADALNGVIYAIFKERGWEIPKNLWVQRNTQQSAVGGCDLTGTWGMAVEVKRQEALSINTWWAQCKASAATLRAMPVLVFRQNKKAWRVVMEGALQLPMSPGEIPWSLARVEISWEEFLNWFKQYAIRMLEREREQEMNRDHQEIPLCHQ